MNKTKKNFLRITYADTLAAEFIMGLYAIVQSGAYLFVPGHTKLEAITLCIGFIRLSALISDQHWLRLAVAYIAAFIWTFVAIFDYLATPGGIGAQFASRITAVLIAFINIWIAWRLQTAVQVKKDLHKDEY